MQESPDPMSASLGGKNATHTNSCMPNVPLTACVCVCVWGGGGGGGGKTGGGGSAYVLVTVCLSDTQHLSYLNNVCDQTPSIPIMQESYTVTISVP